jgi:hypothetical protein
MVDEVTHEQRCLLVSLVFPPSIIILPLPHTHLSQPHQTCNNLNQAAHYHILGLPHYWLRIFKFHSLFSSRIFVTIDKYFTNTDFHFRHVDGIKFKAYAYTKASEHLSKVCFGLRVVRRVTGLEIVRTLYYAYFQSLSSYGLIFWSNSVNVKLIFKLQKRAIRAMTQVPKTTSCKQIFKSLRILPLPSLYRYQTLIYIKSSSNNIATNSGLHS